MAGAAACTVLRRNPPSPTESAAASTSLPYRSFEVAPTVMFMTIRLNLKWFLIYAGVAKRGATSDSSSEL
jgi:hypothetical protein